MRNRIVVCVSILVCSVAWGQSTSTSPSAEPSAGQQSMPGMDMSSHDMSKMKDMPMGTTKTTAMPALTS